jgi:hypothetical protein
MKKNMVGTGKNVTFKDNGAVKTGRVLGKGNFKATVCTQIEREGGMVSVNIEVAYKDLISIVK